MENKYSQSFGELEQTLEQASDSAQFMLFFWEKVVKIEREHARNIEDLCTSRYALLQRMFQNQSVEPVPAVNDLWAKIMGDFNAEIARRREYAEKVHKQICAPLYRFVTDEVPKQTSTLTLGKRVMKDLKLERQKVAVEEKKYAKSSRDVATRTSASSKEDTLRLESAKAADRGSYQRAIEEYNKLCSQSFSSVLPGIVREIRELEVHRLETVRAMAQQHVDTATALHTASYAATAKALTAVTPACADHVSVQVDESHGVAFAEFVEPVESAQPSSAQDTRSREGPGFFSSWFAPRPTTQESTPVAILAPAVPALDVASSGPRSGSIGDSEGQSLCDEVGVGSSPAPSPDPSLIPWPGSRLPSTQPSLENFVPAPSEIAAVAAAATTFSPAATTVAPHPLAVVSGPAVAEALAAASVVAGAVAPASAVEAAGEVVEESLVAGPVVVTPGVAGVAAGSGKGKEDETY